MASLQGLQGLTGLTPTVRPSVVDDSGATAEQIHGTTVNPAHGQWTWDNPVPWAIQQGLDLSGQPATAEAALLGSKPPDAGSGTDPDSYADPTATLSHGGPWPYQHIPDSGAVNNARATAMQAAANAELHSIDSGVVSSFTENPVPGHKMPWDLSPDYNSQGAEEGTEVGQLTGNSHTGWDRFAGWAQGSDLERATAPGTDYPVIGAAGGNLNRFGFDEAHIHRQNPHGTLPVPLDTMQGAQRPLVMNIPGRYGSYPVGQGSPFYGQLPGVGNDTGAAEIGVASDYVPSADAPTNPPLVSAMSGQPVWGYTGLGY
jgi:hypothetical protein